MDSIWTKTTELPHFPPIHGTIRTDAVVIGGGIAGILIAYFLQAKGIKTILLEADTIGSGQTKNTTAKITSQHSLIYTKLIRNFGVEKAKQYATANQCAIEEFATLVNENDIHCDFERKDAFLYTTTDKESLENEWAAMQTLGLSAELVDHIPLPFPILSAIKLPNQAQFNPLKFIGKLAEKLTIYEQSKVNAVEQNKVFLDNATVEAEHIIFATHFPFVNSIGHFFMKMHQERSYVVALKHAQQVNGMYIGIEDNTLSLRNAGDGDILFLGGENHRTGENSQGGRYENLRTMAKKLYPNSEEIGHWSAQDCMSADEVPYIGKVMKGAVPYYVATGFCKWGMTSAMVSAMLISDLILGKENKWDVFAPQRMDILASGKGVLEGGIQAVKGLTKEFLFMPNTELDEMPCGHGGIIKYKDKKMGAYKNHQGEIFLVNVQCPHLGCQLEWNPDEISWDCPCHGSRFDYMGNLMDNPAIKGIKCDCKSNHSTTSIDKPS